MTNTLIYIFAAVLPFSPARAKTPTVNPNGVAQVFLARSNSKTGVEPMTTQAPVALMNEEPAAASEMVYAVLMKNMKQRIDGYGGAFTEACTMHVDKLPPEMRREFLEKLFSKANGAGLDNMRLPIGATDFGDGTKGGYSYDETKDGSPDPKFLQFDMSRDDNTIKLILEALKINPNMQIMISPWSPPSWMKTSKSIFGGQLEKEHYQDFANYFVKVIKEYRKRGLPVTSMTVQNEPYFEWEGVPSMGMTFKEQARFIRDYLGPTLEKNGVKIRIWGHDHNWDQTKQMEEELLGDPKVRHYLAGVAYHCYEGHRFQAADPQRKFPGMVVTNTECSGTDVENNDDDEAFHSWLQDQVVDTIRVGNTGSILWNLCLDQNHGPKNMGPGKVGCQNCRGIVTLDFSKENPVIQLNAEYHALAQVSRFVTPRSQSIEVKGGTDTDAHGIAILNDDGGIVLVAQNMRPEPMTVSFRGLTKGKMLRYELPPRSVATFLLGK